MLDIETWRASLDQLNQAIYNHEQWHKDLTRTIICRLPYDERDVAENAHRQCRFGQWYYKVASPQLQQSDAFIALEAEHARMHALAAYMLRSTASGAQISPIDYDNFANSIERLRLQIFSLKREIEDALYRCDPLTGAESRIDMLTKLREMHDMVKRRVQDCCIAMMDLDCFKNVNNNHGHLIGDQVLKALVQYIKQQLRPYDKIFRYGGEEFLIAMPNTHLDDGQTVIERLCNGIAATAFAHDELRPIFITASFGITALDAEMSVESSIDRADMAMFAAKAAGRNRMCAWKP